MWNFRFKTQKDNLFGGQTVVENTLRQEGNQLVNEGSKNMKQTNLEVYQNRDEKKFISKNNRQSGRKIKNKEKQSGGLGSLSQGFKTRKTSCVGPNQK